MSGPAPYGGWVEDLTSGNVVVGVPASVKIPAGSSTATFPISTVGSRGNYSGLITATDGVSTESATLYVMADKITVSSLTLKPSTVAPGSASTATVTLSQVAPAGGYELSIASQFPNIVSVPTRINFPAGTNQGTFQLQTSFEAPAMNCAVEVSDPLGNVTTAELDISQATTWDLYNDFADYNPNGVWSYGQLNPSFSLLNTFFSNDPSNFIQNDPPGWLIWCRGIFTTCIIKNSSNTTANGIGPHTCSLEADWGEPDARWTAPYAGKFSITVKIGGSTGADNYGDGNADAKLGRLLINGKAQKYTSFTNNVMIFSLTGVQLSKGDTVDAIVGQQSGGGNTQTIFTVTCTASDSHRR